MKPAIFSAFAAFCAAVLCSCATSTKRTVTVENATPRPLKVDYWYLEKREVTDPLTGVTTTNKPVTGVSRRNIPASGSLEIPIVGGLQSGFRYIWLEETGYVVPKDFRDYAGRALKRRAVGRIAYRSKDEVVLRARGSTWKLELAPP